MAIQRNTLNPYHVLGVLHTRGLDYVLQKWAANEPDRPADTMAAVILYTAEYVAGLYPQSNATSSIPLSSYAEQLTKGMNLLATQSMKDLLQRTKSRTEEQEIVLKQILSTNKRDPLKKLQKLEAELLEASPFEATCYQFLAIAIANFRYLASIEKAKKKATHHKAIWDKMDPANYWKGHWKESVIGAQAGVASLYSVSKNKDERLPLLLGGSVANSAFALLSISL